MKEGVICPQCGHTIELYKNPIPTVDIIIQAAGGIMLIKRKNPPHGWAIPGGFIDYGESAEHAAVREAEEETALKIRNLKLFNVYSAPDRDPRFHTISTVFTAEADGNPLAGDDASDVGVFSRDSLPSALAFDHAEILADFFSRCGEANP
jgi:ADP-ribose pyrophosphatase YjhB (NUDIX family)